jgi:hypothetical protein
LRGGSIYDVDDSLLAQYRNHYPPTGEVGDVGFRISEVPEPASIVMLALAGLGILRRR